MSDVADIAILGAGPAGANAALAAQGFGLRVVLLDEQPKPGGQVWRSKSAAIVQAPQMAEMRAGDDLRTRLDASAVTQVGNARVWHIARRGEVWHLQVLRDGLSTEVRARCLVLATGAREYVQPIPGWTTPGVIGLAGATALFKETLSVPGQSTIVSGTGPLVFYVASEIRRLGGAVAGVVTPNTRGDWLRAMPAMLSRPALMARGAVWVADLMVARVPIYWGHAVSAVVGTARVEAVEVSRLDPNWAPKGVVARLGADSLCLGNGLIPQIEAAQMLGVPIVHRPDLGGWVPDAEPDGVTVVAGLYLCGDGNGIRGADAAAAQGRLTGARIAADLGHDTAADQRQAREAWDKATRFGLAMTALSVVRRGLGELTRDDTIVCRCESITRSGVLDEIAKGAASTNAVKSGSRAGMGPCGGKFCQTAIAGLIATKTGQKIGNVAPPTARPPLRPVPLGAAVGAFDYDDLPIPEPAPL